MWIQELQIGTVRNYKGKNTSFHCAVCSKLNKMFPRLKIKQIQENCKPTQHFELLKVMHTAKTCLLPPGSTYA